MENNRNNGQKALISITVTRYAVISERLYFKSQIKVGCRMVLGGKMIFFLGNICK